MTNWKDIVGYEGIYEVSDDGQIRTHKDKTTFSKKHGVRKWKQRVLVQKVGKDDSCRIELYKDRKSKTWLVHRVVALAFIPKVPGKDYINHLDGNRRNNRVGNLEWCNHKENNNHAFDNKLIKTANGIALYNNETRRIQYFRSMAKASEFLGKHHGFVSALLKRGEREHGKYTILS
jgi:HNH endonuclease/NUMOD4 motif